MNITPLLLVRETPESLVGNFIPREALEVIGVGEVVVVGIGEGMRSKRMVK